ncbi:MAG: HupE/UreJ family protein [Methylococcales bacterium]|nr:HupE/UreJ family protein [Methylococcales bacterium]
MNKYISQFAALLVFTLFTNTAFAHVGFHETSDFLNGFVHPFSGLDHVLITLGAGLLASRFQFSIGLTIGWLTSFALMQSVSHELLYTDFALGFLLATTVLNSVGYVLGSMLFKSKAIRLKI